MSRKYKFWESDKMYFVSFATVNWIDVFVRKEYSEELLESWRYCQANKGLEVYAWCIMPSHVHMIISSHTVRDVSLAHPELKNKRGICNPEIILLRIFLRNGLAFINIKTLL